MVSQLSEVLDLSVKCGLGKLRLNEEGDKLLTAELSRMLLIRAVCAKLTGVTFCFDYPSSGWKGEDISELLGLLRRIVDCGNTVIAIDNHQELIKGADYQIELGSYHKKRSAKKILKGRVCRYEVSK